MNEDLARLIVAMGIVSKEKDPKLLLAALERARVYALNIAAECGDGIHAIWGGVSRVSPGEGDTLKESFAEFFRPATGATVASQEKQKK